MEKTASQCARLVAAVGVACAAWMLCRTAAGYTTSSPEVVGMIDRAIPFLESSSHDKTGGMAVIGLALLKNKAPLDHPKIVEAAKAIQSLVASSPNPAKMDLDIYSNGLTIIFLVNYDPDKYAREIQALMASLAAKQKPHGGWGYPHLETGDTSMTQYGVLSTWEAKQVGLAMPARTIDAVADWLLRTQDPGGAWGYQGTLSPTTQLIHQQETRHSMTAAGLGSVYICADLLGMTPELSVDAGRPSALRELTPREPGAARAQVQTSIDPGRLRSAQQLGDGWFKANFQIAGTQETLYYLYALERYSSFRELAEGKVRDPAKDEGPLWYNAGVQWLMANQAADGSWDAPGQCGKPVNTAFGVLFLLRSTQHSIRRARGFGEGLLIGGRGLPKDGNFVSIEGGNVVNKPTQTPFDALRAAMSADNANDAALAAAAERIDQLGPKESQLLVSENHKRLQVLLGDPAPEKRVAAVKMLARGGDLDNAPLLILALEDRDLEVVLAARDGLRRLSRKLDGGYGPPDEPTDAERARAVEKWKAWYLSIRPDAEF